MVIGFGVEFCTIEGEGLLSLQFLLFAWNSGRSPTSTGLFDRIATEGFPTNALFVLGGNSGGEFWTWIPVSESLRCETGDSAVSE